MNTGKIIMALAAILSSALIAYLLFLRTPFSEQQPAVGDIAPEVALADMTGSMITLSGLKGSVVLINFWASWCPPCLDEMPVFEKALRTYGDRGFSVVSIALDDVSPEFVAGLNVSFPVARINDRVQKNYGDIRTGPVTFVIDREGRIANKTNRVHSEPDLMEAIGKALR